MTINTVCVPFGFWRYDLAPVGIQGSCWYQNRFCWYKQTKMASADAVPSDVSAHFDVNEAKRKQVTATIE